MSLQLIVQYATLLWLVLGVASVAVAFFIYRQQVKTQIFLTLHARYDELLQSSPGGLWLGVIPENNLPPRSDDLTKSALRFCILFSVTYFLFRERHIPRRMWHLLLKSAERRMRNPLFLREWEHLTSEFENFPEFVVLVTSVQNPRKA